MFIIKNLPYTIMMLVIMILVVSFALVGCISTDDNEAIQYTFSTPSSSPVPSPSTESSPSPTVSIREADLQRLEEEFVLMIMQALNDRDTATLFKYYDSVYGEVTDYDKDNIIRGVERYREFYADEQLVDYELGKNLEVNYSTSNTICKQYFLVSTSGIRRDIIIKCFNNETITFKYESLLLAYGPRTADRAERYFQAVRNEDAAYLYSYICGVNEEGCEPYDSPKRNEEYASMAVKTIDNYKKTFRLDSMECEMNGYISETTYGYLEIGFTISGLSPTGDKVEHDINGGFEFPCYGVHDTWFGGE